MIFRLPLDKIEHIAIQTAFLAIVATFWLLFPGHVFARTDGLAVSLSVGNSLPIERLSEPVTSGIPLPEDSGLIDPSQLILTKADGITRIPAQFKVLARWGRLTDKRKPLKWILADFQADLLPSHESKYYLKKGTARSFAGLRVTQSGGTISVNTGTMSFQINARNFNLLDKVLLSGQNNPVVISDPLSGITIERKNRNYMSFYGPVQVKVEENGPLRCVILARGKLKARDGQFFVGGDARPAPNEQGRPATLSRPLEYTVRIHAYYGKSYLKVIHTLENNGNAFLTYNPVNDVFIDGLYLKVKANLSRNTASNVGSVAALNATDTIQLFQGHELKNKKNESDNFRYAVIRNGQEISHGKKSTGWFDVSDEKQGLTLGMLNFWEKYPKEIKWERNMLQLGILPDRYIKPETGHYSSGNHYFSDGWHQTTECFLYFHNGRSAQNRISEVFESLYNPPFAACEPAWYSQTKAWSLVAPAGSTNSAPFKRMQDAFKRYEKYMRMFIDPKIDKSIVELRDTRNLNKDHYGWQNFGDLVWRGDNGPYCALHYDWPYTMWLQFIRSGNTAYMRLGKEMTGHSIDIDQTHMGDNARENGIWSWEEQDDGHGHHKSYNGSGLIVSHTWNGGYALGYLLTGDIRYFEAAQRSMQAGRTFWSSPPHTDAIHGQKVEWDQTRSQGWSILMMVNLYRITGDESLLKDALKIFENSLVYTESKSNPPGSRGQGYISYTGAYMRDQYFGKAVITFLTYPLEPLCELHYEARKAGLGTGELEEYLVRSLNWLKNYAYVGGKTNGAGKYSYLTLSYATDPDNPAANNGGELAHNMHVAGAFGYGFLMLKEKNPKLALDYLNFAGNLFKDLMLYRTEENQDKSHFHDPDKYSSVSWGWLPTATKEMGYIGRGGQFYLYAESKR